jgi:rhamnosyltransferase
MPFGLDEIQRTVFDGPPQGYVLDKESICGVMVTWNPDEGLCSRIENIVRQVDRMVVVDNGSSVQEALFEVCARTDISLITNNRNSGIATALNQGIEYARQHGYKWVLTLDQDSLPSDLMVSEQIAVHNDLDGRERIGIIGAHPKDRITRATPYAEECEGKGWIEQTVVITSGSLMSLGAFEKVGPLRDEFFIDGVDHEYCLRLRAHGYRVLVACRAELLHSLGQPAKRRCLWREVVPTNHSYVRRYYLARNRILIAREHFHREPRWIAKQLVALIKSTILVVLFEQDKQNKLKSTAVGIWHGIIGRTGQYFPEELTTSYHAPRGIGY